MLGFNVNETLLLNVNSLQTLQLFFASFTVLHKKDFYAKHMEQKKIKKMTRLPKFL